MIMKRAFISFLAGMASVLCLAQDYEPTTTWPYLYDDFSEGMLHIDASHDKPGLYNIHLLKGRLHFIDGNMIREANPADVYSVLIGSDIYCNVGGVMMKVLAKSDGGFVALASEVDMTRLNSSDGAYGSSSNTAATRNLSSLDAISAGGAAVNHMNLKNAKGDGKSLPVLEKIYLVYDGNVVFASKRDVMELEGVDRKALSFFLKENRIKWKDPQSLIRLVDFINNELKGSL